MDTTQELPKGKLRIGVFTSVYFGDNIEWIPTLFGVRINEWAVFRDSFGDGLRIYYPFNETSGTKAQDFSDISNNGTSNSQIWVTGKLGGALKLNGTNEYVLKLDE